MIKLIIGGIDVSDNVDSGQFGKSEENGGNGFTAVSGEKIGDVTAIILTATIKLKELNTIKTADVIDILNGSEITVNCDFVGYNGTYECDGGYTVSSSRTNSTGIWWEISFTLSCRIPTGGSSADGL